jgi:N-acyl-D-aspartate/D-glutamate deacylase
MGTYAAYPSFFNRYVKEQKLLTLEEAIMKCTSLVAKTHRIKDRGLLRPGYFADIVLFDVDRLKVTGTPIEPRKYPEGIEHVFVNGEYVMKKGRHRYSKPGRVLRHKKE